MNSKPRNGSTSAASAMMIRNIELKGLPMPPLHATSQVSTKMSASRWPTISREEAGVARWLRKVAYRLNKASAAMPAAKGSRGNSSRSTPTASHTATTCPAMATQRSVHRVRSGVVIELDLFIAFLCQWRPPCHACSSCQMLPQ